MVVLYIINLKIDYFVIVIEDDGVDNVTLDMGFGSVLPEKIDRGCLKHDKHFAQN